MSHANGIITAPINTDDVSATIGVASHDVATLCGSYQKINMWARNKPEATGGPAPLSDADRKANNFALRMPTTYTSVQSYVSAATNAGGVQLSGWTYDYPRTSRSDFFRLTDFDNYRSDSLSPFPSLMQGDYVFGQASNGTKVLNLALAAGFEGAAGSTDYIRLADLNKSDAKYSDWYAGVLILKNSSVYYLATSTTKVSQGTSIQFNSNNGMTVPGEGAHTAFVFLANKPFAVSSVGSVAVSGLQLIPITTKAVAINLQTSASALVVYCAIQGEKLAVTVTNKNTTSVVITPVEFQRSVSGSDSDAVKLSTIEKLTAFTVAAGSAANPTVVTKTYSAPIVGMSGFVRLVYKQTIGTGTISGNLTTPWTSLLSPVG